MKEKQPRYTDKYRRECADYALASDKPASQVAPALGHLESRSHLRRGEGF